MKIGFLKGNKFVFLFIIEGDKRYFLRYRSENDLYLKFAIDKFIIILIIYNDYHGGNQVVHFKSKGGELGYETV